MDYRQVESNEGDKASAVVGVMSFERPFKLKDLFWINDAERMLNFSDFSDQQPDFQPSFFTCIESWKQYCCPVIVIERKDGTVRLQRVWNGWIIAKRLPLMLWDHLFTVQSVHQEVKIPYNELWYCSWVMNVYSYAWDIISYTILALPMTR